MTKDEQLGLEGLTDSVAIQFDFHVTLDDTAPYLTDPGQPYVSVQYSNPLTSSVTKSLGMAWLDYSLTKGGQHVVKVRYERAIEDQTDFNLITFTQYGSSLFETETYDLGYLKIYIDDMDRSLLEIPINLGYLAAHDSLDVPNPDTGVYDGSMAGKTFISLSATTSETTDQSAAFQILGTPILLTNFLEWSFIEEEKCRSTSISCYKNTNLISSQTMSKIQLRNIGKEKLYLKLIFKNVTSASYDVNQQYWADCMTSSGEIHPIFIDYSYYNGFLDGCDFDLSIDNTIEDVVITNMLNETYTSLNSYFEQIDENTEIFNDVERICMRTMDDVLEVGFCGCRK